jgi:hypothetical protein
MVGSRNGYSNRHDAAWPLNKTSEAADSKPVIIIGPAGKVYSSADPEIETPPREKHSGKLLVIVMIITILAIFTTLTMAFRQWQTRYQIKANYGITRVAPAVDEFLDIHPTDISPDSWKDAVHRTRAMLLAVTTSNLLSLDDMKLLREELISAVAFARAHPESAVTELAKIWNAMSDRAEFLLRDRAHPHLRPEILPERPRTFRRAGMPLPVTEGSVHVGPAGGFQLKQTGLSSGLFRPPFPSPTLTARTLSSIHIIAIELAL